MTALLTLYLLAAILAVIMTMDRPRMSVISRALIFFFWPWFFYIERTPRMARFIAWAEKDSST
jgi:hypothetical protein